ncbi:MAG: hypothetical protein ACOCQN_01275 [Halanaerobiaceae bacterium]
MKEFPRTQVADLSLSRMIIGTNWFCGYSHTSPAKDNYIKEHTHKPDKIADILEVFLKYGVDTIMGILEEDDVMLQAIKEAEQKAGRKIIKITTPILNVSDSDQARGEAEAQLDKCAEKGCEFCLPHHSCVEQLIDKGNRKIHRIEDYLKMIRDRDMIPGFSAHMPEVIVYADENDYDIETYIQLYNAAGFLMQLEVEWVNKIIQNAKNPVMTIKPMAAGRLTPFVGLSFVWNTIRERDMVTVGTNTPAEAEEDIEISLAALEKRGAQIGGRGTPGENTVMDE